MARHENQTNPICPRCFSRLRNNGKLVTKHHIQKRYRCDRCGYSEVDTPTSMNSNVRTWNGIQKRSAVLKQQIETYTVKVLPSHKQQLDQTLSQYCE